jgi:hypothetical protein
MSEEYGNIDEYKKTKSGTSIAKLGETPFVIVKVDRSDYDSTVGVGLHTEPQTIDGESQNYFYTTREVIVKRFYDLDQITKQVKGETKLFQTINDGKKFKVSCKLIKGKPGKNDYFDLVSVVKTTEQEKF